MHRVYLLFGYFLINVCIAYGQVKLQIQHSISGTIYDSVGNHAVSEATVTLYQYDKQRIIKYGFSNSKGRFQFTEVASTDSIFVIEATHMGYLPIRQTIYLKSGATVMDMGKIVLVKKSIEIEEVAVNKPPIVMNQDTLVINPAAFDLQPNALVEDLLKKIPGIVVWADGEITVNGKKVERVLVNGKPFFGSNNVVSTRNIPNSAVDKVKVYEKTIVQPNEESKMEVDIILKKTNGTFGKVQVGVGTAGRKEGVLLLNYFNSKDQISVFGGKNNTNIRVQSLTDIQRGNVFKAGGEDINVYAPVFTKPGLNNFLVGGSQFKRVWNDQLKTEVDVIYSAENMDVKTSVSEFRYFDGQPDQRLDQFGRQNRTQDQIKMNGFLGYKNKYKDLKINAKIRHVKDVNEQLRDRGVWTEDDVLLSDLQVNNQIKNGQTAADVEIDYIGKYKDNILGRERMNLKYKLSSSVLALENRQISSFKDYVKQKVESTNRILDQRQDRIQHELTTSFDMVPLLTQLNINNWGLQFNNKAKWVDMNADQMDNHFDSVNNSYSLINTSLTYDDTYDEVEWLPGIGLSKGGITRLARGSDKRGFTLGADIAMNYRRNRSNNEQRELDRHSVFLLPSFSLYYQQTRQLWERSFTLDLKSTIRQPDLEQLVAIKDETQKDYNRVGNPFLKPEEQYKFSLEYKRSSSINNASHQLSLNATLIANQMIDSSFFLAEGERISYLINASGKPRYELRYNYRSAPKIGNVPLNISIRADIAKGDHYYYSNNSKYLNNRMYGDLDASVVGTFYEHYKLGLGAENNKSIARSNERKSSSGQNSLSLNTTVTKIRRLTFISSISVTNFYIKRVSSDYQYFWNAHIYYRMLEKEQLEVKLSGFDLLNSSKNIETFIDNNILRRRESNNLRQYFMLSLAYYPRFF